jgi:hypothetical protein
MENILTLSVCPSCGHERPERFCPACGEERVQPEDLSIRRMIVAALRESPFEGRVIRTLVTLLRHPGRVTADYFAGRREPYVRPFRMYVLISILFFFIVPHTGLFRYSLDSYETLPLLGDTPNQMVEAELQRTGETRAAYAERFNETLTDHKKTMMVFLVPMFALGLVPLFRRRPLGQHLVFATHYFAMLLLHLGIFIQVFFKLVFYTLRAMLPIAPDFARAVAAVLEVETTLILFIVVPAIVYLAIATRQAYGVSWKHAIAGSVLLSYWQIVLIVYFYRPPLFFTTFYSLRFFG